MSTREEILAALTEHPDGLTSKELAPLCPAAECDPLIVGRVIAALRSEEVIHAIGLRDGATVYRFGKQPKESTAAEPASARGSGQPLPRPVTTPAPTTARPAEHQANEEKTMTIRAEIEAALKKHGPMDTRAMRKHGLKQETLAINCADLLKREVLVKLGGGPRSTIYGLPGQKLGEAEPSAPTPPAPRKKKMRVKAKSKKGLRPRRAPEPTRKNGAPPRPLTPPANGAPEFAINEHGELGIDAGAQKIRLDPTAFARLRSFIESTEPVWSAAA